MPVVGVGLLYQQGYFRQLIDPEGHQRAVYPYNDPSQLPIEPVRDASGQWVRIQVPFAGSPVWARAWQADVGNTVLYLLDTNIPSNRPEVRGITSELYGGGNEVRLAQEILLGIGGWRLLRALDLSPDVCHLNEGHAAFVVLERARDLAATTGCSFADALITIRAGNLFTTHTPVEARIRPVPGGADRALPGSVPWPTKSASPPTTSWRWGTHPATIRGRCSTWPTWPSGGRERSTGSASSTAT